MQCLYFANNLIYSLDKKKRESQVIIYDPGRGTFSPLYE